MKKLILLIITIFICNFAFSQMFYNSQAKKNKTEKDFTIGYMHTPMYGNTNGLMVKFNKIGVYTTHGNTFKEYRSNRFTEFGIIFSPDNKLFFLSGVGKYDLVLDNKLLEDSWSLNGGLMYNVLPKHSRFFFSPCLHASPVGFKFIGIAGINF
ncbi:MAG: hypothetical protein ACOCVF_02335 [bacterium]